MHDIVRHSWKLAPLFIRCTVYQLYYKISQVGKASEIENQSSVDLRLAFVKSSCLFILLILLKFNYTRILLKNCSPHAGLE